MSKAENVSYSYEENGSEERSSEGIDSSPAQGVSDKTTQQTFPYIPPSFGARPVSETRVERTEASRERFENASDSDLELRRHLNQLAGLIANITEGVFGRTFP